MSNQDKKTNAPIFAKPTQDYLKKINGGLDKVQNGTNEVLKGTAMVQTAIVESGVITKEMIKKFSENGIFKKSTSNAWSKQFLSQHITDDFKNFPQVKKNKFKEAMVNAIAIINSDLQGADADGNKFNQVGQTYLKKENLTEDQNKTYNPSNLTEFPISVKDLKTLSANILNLDIDTRNDGTTPKSEIYTLGTKFLVAVKMKVYDAQKSSDIDESKEMDLSKLPTDMREVLQKMIPFLTKLQSEFDKQDGLTKDYFSSPKVKKQSNKK